MSVDSLTPSHRDLTPSRFVSGRWTPEGAHDARGASSGRAALTLVTWNTWFAPFCFESRFRGLLAEIRTHDPDVICLQEILPESLTLLLEEPWVQNGYCISDTTGDTLDEY